MLVKKCPRCSTIIPYGQSYCKSCAARVGREKEKQRAESAARYNKRRDPKYSKFYHSKPWLLMSARRLDADKYCAICGKPATEVDHIIEIKTPEGWARRLDWNNTRSLCTGCHNERHGRFRRKKRDPGGG